MLDHDNPNAPMSDEELDAIWAAEMEAREDAEWADYMDSLERESQPPQDDRNDGRRAA
jgi:hypothetical protein